MSSITDTAPIPASRTTSGEVRRPKRDRAGALLGIAAWVVGLLFVPPILWMLLTSLHSEPSAATNPPSLGAALTLNGYREFFGSATGTSPWPSLLNSLTASVLSTVLVDRGLIERRPGENRRSHKLALTAEGGGLLQRTVPRAISLADYTLATIDPAQLLALREQLDLIEARLRDFTPPEE